jgi:hypothetical protein
VATRTLRARRCVIVPAIRANAQNKGCGTIGSNKALAGSCGLYDAVFSVSAVAGKVLILPRVSAPANASAAKRWLPPAASAVSSARNRQGFCQWPKSPVPRASFSWLRVRGSGVPSYLLHFSFEPGKSEQPPSAALQRYSRGRPG